MDQELSGLFDSGKTTGQKTEEGSIPENWKSLQSADMDFNERKVSNHIGINMFYPDFSENLDTGRGKDDLVNYVFKHVNGEYDINAWNKFEAEDIIDLNIYLLDELSKEGELRGKDVANYVEEFVEAGGEPEYLEDYSFEPQYF